MRRAAESAFGGLAVGDGQPVTLSIDDEARADPGKQLVSLMSRINLAAIDSVAGDLLLHAGAVTRADGEAAVVCGPSGSGKTTLTVRLVELGFSYVTDEAVCLDPLTLRLRAFRKPAMLKAGSQRLFPHLRPDDDALAGETWLVPPRSFDQAPSSMQAPHPRLLVFPTHTPGAALRLEVLSDVEAAVRAGGDSSRLRETNGGHLQAIARLARRTTAYRLVYDDLDEGAATVAELLAAA